jgi:hypothetical protein
VLFENEKLTLHHPNKTVIDRARGYGAFITQHLHRDVYFQSFPDYPLALKEKMETKADNVLTWYVHTLFFVPVTALFF